MYRTFVLYNYYLKLLRCPQVLEYHISLLSYGFDQHKLEKIIAIAVKENKASIRVMEKIGMEFDKFAPYEEGGKEVIWYQIEKKTAYTKYPRMA